MDSMHGVRQQSVTVSPSRRRAAELLLEEASDESHHQQPVFEPELIVRESSMVRRTEEQTS